MTDDVLSLRAGVLEESARCEKQWEKWTGHIKDIKDEYLRGVIALLLENQRLVNEQCSECGNEQNWEFKRRSLDLVKDVFTNALFTKIASIQPMIGPTGFVYYKDKGEIKALNIAAKTRRLSILYGFDEFRDNYEGIKNQILDDLNWETYTDLWNNATTLWQEEGVVQRTAKASLTGAIEELKKRIHVGEPNFLVTTPDVAAECPEIMCPVSTYLINRQKKQHEWDVDIEGRGILIGYKGEEYMDSGYSVSPYVPFTKTPTVLDPDSFCPRRGLLIRYDKKLAPGGSAYYGKIVLDD